MTSRSGPTVLTFALEDWPRKDGPSTRASKPKVRTGCITCKRRRVKCDETKPTCQNCTKRRISCEGYITEPRAKTPPKQALRNSRESGSVSPIFINPNYESLVFTTQLQRDHFDNWLLFAKDALIFPSELITETIPQLARSDLAVRNAAFAIGAASLGSSTREQRLKGEGPYYADALKYYNRSLQLTATSPTTEEAIPRVLLTCLLFFMFEALQGNRKEALIHLNHGCRVLDHYERRFGRKSTPLIDAIIANSQRLTMQSWSHNGYHPEETEDEVPWCCRGRRERYAVDEIPDEFESIDEAHRWWEVTQHFVIRHAPLIIGFRVEGTGSKAPATYPPNQSLPIPPEQVKGYARYIERWQARFLRLMEAEEQRGGQKDDKERLKVLGLQIQSGYLTVPVRTANYTDVETLATLNDTFREVVSLSKKFLKIYESQPKSGEVFTMDSNSPTWALGAASMLCADETTRADAARLLREFPRRDGLWDTQTYVAMMEAVEKAKQAITGRLGQDKTEHPFDYEVVYEDKSVSWVKTVDNPEAVEPDMLEYKIEIP